MSCSKIPQIVLKSSSNQSNMPLIAFGTAAVTNNDGEITKAAVVEAIKSGYRHFDTASIYGSEEALGEAIQQALQLGLIQSREITPDPEIRIFGSLFDPLARVWIAMEECQKLGLTKSIGVSNFTCKKLEDLLSFATILPSVNQVEMNPVWHQKKLKEYCEAKGIIITAFSPLGAKGTMWGSNEVIDSEILKQIAEEHGKTVAQVCLRWLYEQGVSMAVKSYNKDRMKQNLEIFDWSLTRDDHEKIDKIKQIRVNNGPFAFIPDIWDGET
ncbi:unnamed protein product [Vicia faba]|uniref:NADP-dependent oxidoreductase domain-containing protein n=1 Tax=Vicia faba TaxID=3906 RepID=A0AAV0ZYK0_VICFA|nr:unnamed protein product [Vicia faba]